MLYFGSKIGIGVSKNGFTCAVTGGTAVHPRVEKLSYAPLLPGTLRFSLRELNVLEPEVFIAALKNAYNQLSCSSVRAAVSLPDAVSRLLLLDLEARFKNRVEALDLIRWKLKKSIPLDMGDTNLDYQQLSVRDNGDLTLLVSISSRTVITQYEDLITAAGFSIASINCDTFNICRCFERQLSSYGESVLVFFYAGTLSIIVFDADIPVFFRSKDLAGVAATDGRVFMEIDSSLRVYKERFPEKGVQKILCVAAPEVAEDFRKMVAEASGSEVELLEMQIAVKPVGYESVNQLTVFSYLAAIGASLRSP